MDEDNDGRFPDDSLVEVPTRATGRNRWVTGRNGRGCRIGSRAVRPG